MSERAPDARDARRVRRELERAVAEADERVRASIEKQISDCRRWNAPKPHTPAERQELIGCAQAAYVRGEIELEDFEAALEHIYADGRGCPEFPFLPMYPMPLGGPIPDA